MALRLRGTGSRTKNVDPWPASERKVSVPAKLLEDLPADKQAQTGAVGLGGEERLKQPAAVGDRDPSPVVLDAQDQPALFGPGVHVDPPLVVRGVDRVENQVEDDLGQVITHARMTAGKFAGTSVVMVRCLVRW